MSVRSGAAYLFIETIFSTFFGYVFWFVMSRIATPEIIGISSTAISFATIFIIVSTIGIPTGVQRFLAKAFSENKEENAKLFVKASLLLITIGIVASAGFILIFKDWLGETFEIGFNLLIVSILLIASSSIAVLFRSVIIASLKTKNLPVITVLSSVVKLILAITLVTIGAGALGITIGFTIFPILASIFLAVFIMLNFRSSMSKPENGMKHSLKNILIASVVTWLPSLIYTTGINLGSLVVFSSQGASHAGVYFIALSIVSALSAVTSVLLTIAFPVLSTMHDGRKRLAWRITKLSLVITLPLSCSIIFYSKNVMQLFGQSYVDGSSILEILLFSMLPTVIMIGINTLMYSYGNYRQVLVIGLAASIPRIVSYFIFVPLYGSTGAAISFTVGSTLGFIVAVCIARKIRMIIFWKEVLLILIVSIGFPFIFRSFEMNYLMGIILTLVASYVLFLKLGILNRTDLHDALGILPCNVANPILRLLDIIAKKLNRTY